jgi:hypothetical protein
MALTTIHIWMFSISSICSGSSIYSICNNTIRTTNSMCSTTNYICGLTSHIKYTNPAATHLAFPRGHFRLVGCRAGLEVGYHNRLDEGKVRRCRGHKPAALAILSLGCAGFFVFLESEKYTLSTLMEVRAVDSPNRDRILPMPR